MKSKYVSLSLLILLVFFSCDTSEENELIDTHIVDLDMTAATFSQSDIWILITDANGNLLNWKQWDHEPQISLNAALESDVDKVNILFFYGDNSGASTRMQNLTVYTNIAPGASWKIGPVSVGHSGNNESCSLNIENIPSGYQINDLEVFQDGWFAEKNTSCTAEACNVDLYLFDASKKTIFSFTPGDVDPVYFETDTLQNGRSYTCNFESTFVPFQHILKIPNQVNNLVVSIFGGVRNNVWERQSLFATTLRANEFRIGYNDGYDQYQAMYFTLFNNKSYLVRVLAPEITAADFELPEKDFTVLNKDISHFNFSIDLAKTVENRLSRWQTNLVSNGVNEIFQVSVVGGHFHEAFTLKELPAPLTSAYAITQNIGDLTYINSTFTFVDNGDYNTYLDRTFVNPIGNEPMGNFLEISK
jgi:hypothetical protein